MQAHRRLTVGLVQMQLDQRVLVGQLGQTGEQRRALGWVHRLNQRLHGRRRKAVRTATGWLPKRVPDPRRRPAHRGDLARPRDGVDRCAAGIADRQLGYWHRPCPADRDPVAHPDLARPEPDPRPPATLVPVDGEHGASDGTRRAGRAGQDLGEHPPQLGQACAGDRRAAHRRRQRAAAYAVSQCPHDVSAARGLPGHPAHEHLLVDLGRDGDNRLVGVGDGDDPDRVSALIQGLRELDDGRRQAAAYPLQYAVHVGPGAVHLVDEQHRRNPDALQGAPDHHGLRLHVLDRRQHEHGRVEHAKGALDLGDEVGVSGRVHEVDVEIAEDERRHRGADGDPAPTLQRHRVGAGRARVDAPGGADNARLEQQALGQAGLAGVNMRDDPDIEY